MKEKNKICVITTLKAPLNQTLSFVNYHLNIGVDHMFLFFDNPNDPSMKELQKYKRVTCFRCNKIHWDRYTKEKNIPLEKKQRINSKIALEMAFKRGYKWIAHIDSDELIYINRNLKEYLLKIPKNIDYVRFPTLEALPEKIEYKNRLKEVKLFKRNFGKISKKYFKGNIAGKSFTKISNKIENLGIHIPQAKKGYCLKYKFSLIGRILHFDCAGFEEWKTKWEDRLKKKTIAIEMGKIRKKIIKEFSRVYKKNNKKELIILYKKQFFIKKPLKIFLRIIGVLKKINLNPELFEKT